MINQLKNDRVAQLLAAAVLLAGLVVCVILTYGGYAFLTRHRPVQAAPAITITPTVYSFNGSGDDVVFFEAAKSGRTLVGLGHRGDRNFIVNIIDSNGYIVEQVANEVGRYDGEKAIHLDQGRYTVEITADGPWGIVILPPQ